MIMKTLLGAVLGVTMLATPALALEQFYNVESGQWRIEGYTGEKNFCSAKTYWQNESYVSLFVLKNAKEAGLYVHNTDWNLDGDFGTYYSGTIVFSGSRGITSGKMDFELVDPQTIILRGLKDKFLNDWVDYRTMKLVMPNNIPSMTIGLTGTAAATSAFVECLEILESH
jgi:hypothetical protein